MKRWLALLCACAMAAQAVATPPPRVLALGGDITETVYAVGGEKQLVGVDSTSQYPTAAQALPNVGYVRQLGAEGILALKPDLVIATHDAGPPPVIAQLREAGLKLELLPTTRDPQAVIAKVQRIGALLGRVPQAQALAATLQQDYAALARAVAAMRRHPKVAFLMYGGSGSAMMAGRGSAADAAIALAGGVSVGEGFNGYKPVSAEALAALAPDAIVLMGTGAQAAGRIEDALKLPGVALTPAGRARRLWYVDGQALLGFGPRNAGQERELQQRLAGVP